MGDKATQRIFKSLVMILVVTVMPWAVYMLFKTSLTYIKLSPLELWYAGSIIGYGIIFASIADILILYTFSYKRHKNMLIRTDIGRKRVC
uniref:Uncharacterized protein n=1 Tax=Ditylenchus dipsaci TaxID=166011 RepID=A0A915DPL2_9BILA